jgi:predicted nucleotidyltransferase
MNLAPLVERFVDTHFPGAVVVVVGGSAASGNRTATSDIDLLIIGPEQMFENGRDSLAAMYEFVGELFEVFAYTRDAFDRWAVHDLTDFKPVLQSILLDGIEVRGEALIAELRSEWRPVVEAGPRIDHAALALRRYTITDMLDDFGDASDELEKRFLAAKLLEGLAELILMSNGQWIGGGKWLIRRLRAWDTDRANELAAPFMAGDLPAFAKLAALELERLGGRVQAGFVR